MDKDGYPDDHELQTIKDWDGRDGRGLMEYVHSLWNWTDHVWIEDDLWNFATGGWSGNEDLIGAMAENRLFWTFHWESSERGGKYRFRLRDEQKVKDDELVELRRVVSNAAATYDALVKRAEQAETKFKIFYKLTEESLPYIDNKNARDGFSTEEKGKQMELLKCIEEALLAHREENKDG